MEKVESNITNRRLIISLILIMLMKPAYINELNIINSIYNIGMILASTLIIATYIKNIKKDKVNKLIIVFLLFFIELFISTAINNNGLVYFFKTYTPIIAIILYTDILIRKGKVDKLLDCLSIIMSIYLFINMFTIICNTNLGDRATENRTYFLGYDNVWAIISILSSYLLILRSYRNHGKITIPTLFILTVITISAMLVVSATAKVGILLTIMFLIILYKKNKFSRMLNYDTYIIISLIIFVLITFFRVHEYFGVIIENIFHRDITLTGRTLIWNRVIDFIKTSPLIGFGIQDMDIRSMSIGIYHAHSTYLNIIFEGGMISFIIYLIALSIVGKEMRKNRENEFVNIISFAIFVYFLMGTIEVYTKNQLIYILLILGFYTNKILEKDIIEKEKKKRKILYLLDCSLSTIGGSQKSTISTIREMVKLNYEVYVFMQEPNVIPEDLGIKNVYSYAEKKEQNTLKYNCMRTKILYQTIKEVNPDIIHAQNYMVGILMGMLKKFNFIPKGCKCIFQDRGFLEAYWKRHQIAFKIVSEGFDEVICTTSINQKNWERKIKKNNVNKIPNVLEDEWHQYDEEKVKKYKREYNIKENIISIGFSGRFEKYKRWDTVEKICKKISQNENIYIFLAIATMSEENRKEVEEYIKRLKDYLGNRIIAFIDADEETMMKFYYVIDFFILTSEKESFGRTLIEAMTKNTIVLGTNSGGVPDVLIDQKYLFEVDDSSAVVKKIEEYMENKEKISIEKEEIRVFAKTKYSIENYVTLIKKSYEYK